MKRFGGPGGTGLKVQRAPHLEVHMEARGPAGFLLGSGPIWVPPPSARAEAAPAGSLSPSAGPGADQHPAGRPRCPGRSLRAGEAETPTLGNHIRFKSTRPAAHGFPGETSLPADLPPNVPRAEVPSSLWISKYFFRRSVPLVKPRRDVPRPSSTFQKAPEVSGTLPSLHGAPAGRWFFRRAEAPLSYTSLPIRGPQAGSPLARTPRRPATQTQAALRLLCGDLPRL